MDAPSPSVFHPLARIGDLLALVGRAALFTGQIAYFMVRRPFFFHEILDATALVAQRCLLPVLLTVAPFGMVVSLHGTEVFRMFGAERMLGLLVGFATLRELAPNLAGILIAAQAGSAFAAELSAMRAQEEIDATLVMGINPIKYHVIPRVLGIVLAAPLLTALASAAGLTGGYLLATLKEGQNGGAFLDNLFAALSLFDLWSGTLKAAVFGLIIGIVACFLGYNARGGALGVGRAVNDTVVYSITLFLLVNYFLSMALFGIVE